MLVVKLAEWVAGVLIPSSLMVLQVDVKVTRTVFGVFFLSSGSESDDEEDEDEDDEEGARRAFFVVVFFVGGWLGLFLPNWSLSEKRSLFDRPIEMTSVDAKIRTLD